MSWIVGALEGAASIGIPKDSVTNYETALESDKFLVIAHGSADEVQRAESILEQTRPASPKRSSSPERSFFACVATKRARLKRTRT